jgi:hypothetical protein
MDRERFGFMAPRREVSIAAGDRKRPGRNMLARRAPVIEQDKQGGLPAHLNRRLSQSSGHAKYA